MLVKCYECGCEISDMAKTCPHCGAPMRRSSLCRNPFPKGMFRAALRKVVHPSAKNESGVLSLNDFLKAQGLVCFMYFIIGACIFFAICLVGGLIGLPTYVGSMALLTAVVFTLRTVPTRKKYVGYLEEILQDRGLSPEEVAFAEQQKADSIRRMERFDLICRIIVIVVFICAVVGGYIYYFC